MRRHEEQSWLNLFKEGGERLFTVPFPGATLLHLKTRS